MWDLNSKCPIKVQFVLLPAVVPKPAQKPVQTVTESGVLCYVPVVFKLHFLEPQHSAVMSQRLRVRRRRTGNHHLLSSEHEKSMESHSVLARLQMHLSTLMLTTA